MKRILRMPEIVLRSGVSDRSTIYSWIRKGIFPKLVKIGPRASGLPEDEFNAWEAERKALRDTEAVSPAA